MGKVILGGGLSGLSAAYYLSKKAPSQALTLIEASNRTGGWIRSHQQPNGVIFEQGPRTIRPRGEAGRNTLQLIEELNLSDKIISIKSDHAAARHRMIYAKGNLHMLPSSLGGIFKKREPFTRPIIFYLLNDLKAKKKQVQDEPIYDFINRRFGKEIADYLISPLICGICAGNAQEVSVNFLMRRFFEYEQQYGSISNGIFRNVLSSSNNSTVLDGLSLKAKQEKWNVYSFTDGCETLPLTLRKSIENNVDIIVNTKCKQMAIDKNGVVLNLEPNRTIKAEHVICAIPANNLGMLMENQHPNLAKHLKRLTKNVSVAVINLCFDKQLLKKPAFGFLVAPKEQLPILGVIFDSCCFPKDNNTVLTVMMGGYWFDEYFGKNPDEEKLLKIALGQLKSILGIDDIPVHFKVNILQDCLPQYIVGHSENLQKINEYLKVHELPISLCGASYHGVGINDVILSAQNAVKNLQI